VYFAFPFFGFLVARLHDLHTLVLFTVKLETVLSLPSFL